MEETPKSKAINQHMRNIQHIKSMWNHNEINDECFLVAIQDQTKLLLSEFADIANEQDMLDQENVV